MAARGGSRGLRRVARGDLGWRFRLRGIWPLLLLFLVVSPLCAQEATGQGEGGRRVGDLHLVEEIPDADAGSEVPFSVPPGPWHRVEARHFTLFGNTPVPRLVGLASDLERLRYALSRLAPDLELDEPRPVLVYVFDGEASLAPFRSSDSGLGYFVTRPQRGYAVLNGGRGVNSSGLLYREYVYHLLSASETPLPPWLLHGLAEIFRSFEARDGTGVVGLPPGTIHVGPSEWWPLEELLTSRLPADPIDEIVFRSQVWTLTHRILVDRDDQGRGLAAFLESLSRGEEPLEALEEAVGDVPWRQLRDLAPVVERYQEEELPLVRLDLEALGQIDLAVFPMGEGELSYRLGDLLVEVVEGRRQEAQALLSAAVEESPSHAGAWLDLGRLAEEAGRLDAAVERYGRAVELLEEGDPEARASGPAEPLDTEAERAQAHFLHGSALLETLGGRRPADEAGRRRLARAQRSLRRASRFAPWRGEIWSQLTRAYGLDPEPREEELEIVEEALDRFPERVELLTNAALAFGRRGQRGRVEEIQRRLADLEADAGVLTRVEEILLRLDFYRADRLVLEDSLDEAVALFARIQSRTTDPRLRRQVTERIGLMEKAEQHNRFVELFVRVYEELQSGELERAREGMALLRELARPGAQRDAVEDLGRAVRGAVTGAPLTPGSSPRSP